MSSAALSPEAVIDQICSLCSGIVPKASWGETALFYNPDRLLPNGIYFCTLKEHDGSHDKAASLDRPGVYRVALGLTPLSYERLLGPQPARPAKGGVVSTGHDFSVINQLMPHPIYAWMYWMQILSPTPEMFATLIPLILESHQAAIRKFQRKVKQGSRSQILTSDGVVEAYPPQQTPERMAQ